ncbi:MAG: Ig-like domain-containing protein [Deltaproteobacteria bacterium]|nr:Ig-like domain-containing protein [Deltaproteobacteria bacterium]
MARSPASSALATLALAVAFANGGCRCSPTPDTAADGGVAIGQSAEPPAEPPPFADHQAAPAVAHGADGDDQARVDEAPWPRILSGCESADCVIELAFPVAMVRDHAKAPPPAVRTTPTRAGTAKWTSDRTLTWTPAAGALPWGHQVTLDVGPLVALDGREQARGLLPVTAPTFRAAGKVAEWPTDPGKPRFVALLNDFANQIGTGAVLALYDQPVDAVVIGKDARAQVNGKALSLKATRPTDVLQVTEMPVDVRHVVALVVDLAATATGDALELTLPSWQGEQRGTAVQELVVQRETTLAGARLPDGTDAKRVPLSTVLTLSFQTPVSAALVKKHLTIEPAPKDMAVSAWREALVRLELAPGTSYTVTTTRGLTDIFGNPIAAAEVLRFTTQDLPPMLALAQASVVVERGRALLPVRARNVGPLSARLERLTDARAWITSQKERCATRNAGAGATVSSMPPPPSRPNEPVSLDVDVGAAAGTQGGLFCLRLEAPGTGSEANGVVASTMPLQITDLGVTTKLFEGGALVWVTKLSNAQPVAGAVVELFDERGERLAGGTSAADGTVRLELGGIAAGLGTDKRAYVAARTDNDRAVAELGPGRLAEPWLFGLPSARGPLPLPAALFTERGAYRPGERVQLKVIVGIDDTMPAVPAGKKVALVVTDPRGQQLLDKALALDAFGSAHAELALKDGADVGEWSARATLDGRGVGTTFRVEEFRVPTFAVKVTAPDAHARWGMGRQASARVSANYLHGGALSGRPVKVRVTRAPEPFAPAQFPGFTFALDAAAAPAADVIDAAARLDGLGLYGVELPLDRAAGVGAVRYTVEAVVTDVDRQAYAGRLSRVVHPARFALGIKAPPRAVIGVGETLEVPLITVASEDQTVLPGIRVRARLERIDAHTTARAAAGGVQLEGHDVVVAGEVCTVTTTAGAVPCRFTVPAPGRYRVRAWGRDQDGNDVQTGFSFTASGNGVAAWPRFDQERVELIADKPAYGPGDTAKLVVASPFETATALLTVEHAGVLEHRVVQLDRATPALSVALGAQHAPNAYASVVLLRGRVHGAKDASGFDTGAPAMRLGATMLRVEPKERRLAVSVSTDRAVANPGGQVTVHLEARDHTGAVPPSAQATVMVVDEAVLGLTGYQTPDPVALLHRERPLGVRTGESRLETLFAMRGRRDNLFPAGDGGDGLSLADFPDDVRSLFKSTAHYVAAVSMKDGAADVRFTLPDNVTTYRVMAVVVATGARTGAADVKLVAKKPLLVQAVTPRFVHRGDKLRIEALAFNASGAAGEVELGARVDGLKIVSLGPPATTVRVEDGKQGAAAWDVEVTGHGPEAEVRLVARLGKLEDAVLVKVPIRNPGTRRTLVATASVTGRGGAMLEVPGDRVLGTTKVEVLASQTMLTELGGAVQYLMGYPNGCIEQTTSTAYPLVLLEDLLPEIGVEVNKEDLRKYRDAGIKRILSFQTTQGGLAYWPGSDEPHAFATAFGLTALIEAKRKGQYDVPDEALRKMGDYLERALQKGTVTEEIPHGSIADGDTRALFVMTLGRLNRPQHAWVETLWRERDKLTPFGLSFLATAVEEGSGNRALKEPILAAIAERAAKNDAEAWYEGAPRGGYSMDSPLRTHAGAVLAFASGAPRQDIAGRLVTGFLHRQQGGMWGNTQENVFGMMGIAAMARATEAPGDGPALTLMVNGFAIDANKLEAPSARTRRLRLDEAALGIGADKPGKINVVIDSKKPSPVNLRVRVEYEAALTPENKKARSNGFTIARTVETLEGKALSTLLPLGQVVRVRLSVEAKDQNNYVAIDDKLPAGLEPMNLALDTTEKLSLGAITPERQRATERLSYTEMRDHRVAFFIDDMPPGRYELVYLARATMAGHFLRPAASVEAMYQPERSASTAIDEVDVK